MLCRDRKLGMHNRTCAKDKSCTKQATLQEAFQNNTLASSQEVSESENQFILSYVFIGPACARS